MSTPAPPAGGSAPDGTRVVVPLPQNHPPKPLAQRVGAVLWPSFFSAAASTLVFFAVVDPLELREITFPHVEISREIGYTVAFFLFWLACAGSSLFTWLLLRPPGRFSRALPPEDRGR